ncbi:MULTISPECIES: DUF3316 domain-containing protein [Vibrio]|jgi:hypothetical protein|uniref:DUF3316 domain-containing protein n=1 Tax=Vibrio TaxID=662 RepID=UPI000471C901|nr:MULTISPECIES: DUF3316 domain-containing protein [Vibrio]EGR2554268.1 DUF3316 domain-containing protein [Vibrio alginolyticus]EJL6789621.1 DUF3316 domain-containing protein [Vibrio alginolyticus]ELE6588738.1 DUF3316 domain-containing protein [Vibrio alginolyticus]ELH9639699.1 DUF3316 domain-containing protein [Vibrio alginolyticus]ELI1598576.1 DUF3316 domain-containing protein [Vibrio alginolyticus]
MNVLVKTLLIGSIILTSATSIAQPLYSGSNYMSRVDHKIVSIDAVSSKQQAYTLGAEKLSEFEAMNGGDLSAALVPVRSYGITRNTTHLKDKGYVTVQERLNNQGQLEYVAKVHLNVHYQMRDSNN